jgi:hypothetical protein
MKSQMFENGSSQPQYFSISQSYVVDGEGPPQIVFCIFFCLLATYCLLLTYWLLVKINIKIQNIKMYQSKNQNKDIQRDHEEIKGDYRWSDSLRDTPQSAESTVADYGRAVSERPVFGNTVSPTATETRQYFLVLFLFSFL